MDSADWYGRVASKLEGQQQAVVAGTARRLLHFQGILGRTCPRAQMSTRVSLDSIAGDENRLYLPHQTRMAPCREARKENRV